MLITQYAIKLTIQLENNVILVYLGVKTQAYMSWPTRKGKKKSRVKFFVGVYKLGIRPFKLQVRVG